MKFMGAKVEVKETASATALASLRTPQHIGIIMDGNGRWAKNRGWVRSLGHVEGSSRVKEIIREADRLGVKVLTLYAFSTENWKRPADEVDALMKLLEHYLQQERQDLLDNNVRFQVFGELEKLPDSARRVVQETIDLSKDNTGMILNFCVSYGGRSEIIRAVQHLYRDVASGARSITDITEKGLSDYMYSAGLPDPDLIIRTSGEFRISNFLLWQIAYSEIFVTDTLWPDFEPRHLRSAIEAFASRRRRFGLSDESELRPQDSP